MSLALVKSLWGVNANPSNWDVLFNRIKAEGYEAIECVGVFSYHNNPILFKQMLQKYSLSLVVQVHTSGGYFNQEGEYVYCSSSNIDDHVKSFRLQVIDALEMGAIVINCHSGHDSWSLDSAVRYFSEVLEIEKILLLEPKFSHVKIVHETHRQRLLYSPFQTRDILMKPELRDLKINADLSHWVCVCERLFDLSDPRDSAVCRTCNKYH
jgi:sugar phosphate isomerase/epimerase